MKLKIFILLLSFANLCPNTDGAPRIDPSKSKGKQRIEDEETETEDQGSYIRIGNNISTGGIQEIAEPKIGTGLENLLRTIGDGRKGNIRLEIGNNLSYGPQKIGQLEFGTSSTKIPSYMRRGSSSSTPRQASTSKTTSVSRVRNDTNKQGTSSNTARTVSKSNIRSIPITNDTNEEDEGDTTSDTEGTVSTQNIQTDETTTNMNEVDTRLDIERLVLTQHTKTVPTTTNIREEDTRLDIERPISPKHTETALTTTNDIREGDTRLDIERPISPKHTETVLTTTNDIREGETESYDEGPSTSLGYDPKKGLKLRLKVPHDKSVNLRIANNVNYTGPQIIGPVKIDVIPTKRSTNSSSSRNTKKKESQKSGKSRCTILK